MSPLKFNQFDLIKLYLFLTITTSLLLFAKGYLPATDSAYSVYTSKAIIERWQLNLQNCPNWMHGYLSPKNHLYYSKYGIGLALVWIPFVAVAKIFSILFGINEGQLTGFLISFYNIPVTGILGIVLYNLLQLFGITKKRAVLTVFFTIFSSVLVIYSVADFSEALQGLLILATYSYVAFNNNKKNLLLGSLFISLLILVKSVFIILLPIFLVYILILNRNDLRKKFGVKIICFLIIPSSSILITFLLNWVRFGNIFETGYGREALLFDFSQIPFTSFYLLFGLEKGIFFYSPILFLTFFTFPIFFSRFRNQAFLLIVLIACVFFINASWHAYEGGWSWGPRLLVPCIPLLGIPLGWIFEIKYYYFIFWPVLLLSLLVQLVGISVNYHQYLQIAKVATETASFREKLPSPIIGSSILALHKITIGDEDYRLKEFGINSNLSISHQAFETYHGFNFWYSHLSRLKNNAYFKLVPFFILPIVALLFCRIFKKLKECEANRT